MYGILGNLYCFKKQRILVQQLLPNKLKTYKRPQKKSVEIIIICHENREFDNKELRLQNFQNTNSGGSH